MDFKKLYHSVRSEGKKILHNIHIEFGIPRKLLRLIKMCLNEAYSIVRIGKYSSDMFSTKNSLKQGDALSPLIFNFVL